MGCALMAGRRMDTRSAAGRRGSGAAVAAAAAALTSASASSLRPLVMHSTISSALGDSHAAAGSKEVGAGLSSRSAPAEGEGPTATAARHPRT